MNVTEDKSKDRQLHNKGHLLLFCKLNYAPFCKLYGTDFGAIA